MATSAYHNWDGDGRPWRVAKPIKAIGDRLRAHGYVVYHLGADDETHLKSPTPEDHTPFSRTGWPKPHPYPWITALDIMPPKKGQRSKVDGKPLPSLQALGRQIHKDKQANHPGLRWLKYMNWEPDRDWGGRCWHDSWQPGYKRRTSGDRGHIHASGRTDHVTTDTSRGYDPVARLRTPTTPGDDMTPAELFKATILNPVTGKPATFAAFIQSINTSAYAARQSAAAADAKLAGMQTAIVTALGQVDENVAAQLAGEFQQLNEAAAARDEDERARDAAAAQERADIRALVQQGQDGTLDAAAVVQRIGELLAGQQGDA